MMVLLTPEQEAARQLIAELADDDGGDDLAWAKPYIDEGLAALDRGEFITLDEHRAHNAALLASLKA
jgi:antitoxin ParD1/3/4